MHLTLRLAGPLLSQRHKLSILSDLQSAYSNYKNTLQQIAQKIGDIEQEAEEHKYVLPSSFLSPAFALSVCAARGSGMLPSVGDSSSHDRLRGRLHRSTQASGSFLSLSSLFSCFLTGSHRLVLETLDPLPGDRKCFRLINGVLVERTVRDVVPALQTNQEGLRKVLGDLVKQYKSKQDELDVWKVCESYLKSLPCPCLLTTLAEEEQCTGSPAMTSRKRKRKICVSSTPFRTLLPL